jgi:hypothetical protein
MVVSRSYYLHYVPNGKKVPWKETYSMCSSHSQYLVDAIGHVPSNHQGFRARMKALITAVLRVPECLLDLFDDNFCRDWPDASAQAPKQEVSNNFSYQLAETRRGVARPTWLVLLLLLGTLVLVTLRRRDNQQ